MHITQQTAVQQAEVHYDTSLKLVHVSLQQTVKMFTVFICTDV